MKKKNTKKTKKEKKSKPSLAKKILIHILNSAVDFSNEMEDIQKYGIYSVAGSSGRIAEIERARERRYLREELARLKREKLIKEEKVGDQLVFCLTEKGKNVALRYKILYCNDLIKDKYYLVIFDIPELERKTRDFFRHFLKEAGFIRLQQSVWLTQKDIEEYLAELIRAAGAEKWIHIVTATKISNFSFEEFLKERKSRRSIENKIENVKKEIKNF